MSMPQAACSSSVARCCGVALPGDPKVSPLGSRLAWATSSAIVLAGRLLLMATI
ncbi:hypothetical protein D3C78_1689950 [compost metagenome]